MTIDELIALVRDDAAELGCLAEVERALADGRVSTLNWFLRASLDLAAPRLPEELDLAEAVCAIKWPKWPTYHGPIDLALLRRALLGTSIDGATLNWLGGKEIVRECRALDSG